MNYYFYNKEVSLPSYAFKWIIIVINFVEQGNEKGRHLPQTVQFRLNAVSHLLSEKVREILAVFVK